MAPVKYRNARRPGRKKYAPPRTVTNGGKPDIRRRRRPLAGMVKRPVTGQPVIAWRLPTTGSFSPVKAENLLFIVHAFCKNSKWREMFAFRQAKWSPRS